MPLGEILGGRRRRPLEDRSEASKNFAKYPFDEKDGKKYLEYICSMKGWSDKIAILNFLSQHDLTAFHVFHINSNIWTILRHLEEK